MNMIEFTDGYNVLFEIPEWLLYGVLFLVFMTTQKSEIEDDYKQVLALGHGKAYSLLGSISKAATPIIFFVVSINWVLGYFHTHRYITVAAVIVLGILALFIKGVIAVIIGVEKDRSSEKT